MNPCNIPTIAELGNHKGGYALVKQSQKREGLNQSEKICATSIKKTRDLESARKPKERTKMARERKREINRRRYGEKMMSLYSSEAADPGSTGINMSLNEISDLMDSDSE